MNLLNLYREQIIARKPFTSVQVKGYKTRGGSYIIASCGIANDDGKDRDLMAITPHGVVALSPLAVIEPVIQMLDPEYKSPIGPWGFRNGRPLHIPSYQLGVEEGKTKPPTEAEG